MPRCARWSTRSALGRSRIVRIAYTDGPGPALLSREVYAEAGHLHGDIGARALMASHPDWVEEVVVPFHAPPPTSIARRTSRASDQLAAEAHHRSLVRLLEPEPRVEAVRIARVEEPGEVAVRRMLHGLADELHPEPVPSMALEDEHVAEPGHARAIRHHAREPDLLPPRYAPITLADSRTSRSIVARSRPGTQ